MVDILFIREGTMHKITEAGNTPPVRNLGQWKPVRRLKAGFQGDSLRASMRATS
jgi:hypothetical protein